MSWKRTKWKLQLLAFLILAAFLVQGLHFAKQLLLKTQLAKTVVPRTDLPILKPSQGTVETDYDRLACKYPLLDPWDPEIQPLISIPDELECATVQPDLSFIKNRQLYLNQSVVNQINSTGLIKCNLRGVDRDTKDDYYAFTQPFELTSAPTSLTDYDIYYVTCTNGTDVLIYKNIHTNPRELAEKARPGTEENLSVLLFFLESTSHSLFRRHLPQTYDYLQNELEGTVIFHGYTKVGDNSFPNILPILTGKRVMETQSDLPDEFEILDYNETYFDDFPFIWKNYANEAGYLTAFFEDTPTWGLFHYWSKGFRRKPVDYYYRPYYLARDNSRNMLKKSTKWCFGNEPKISMELEALENLLKLHGAKNRLFTYFFHTELGHEAEESTIRLADTPLVEFFLKLTSQNLLNNSVLFVLSDHGHRYSSIRSTHVGQLEGSMPMFSIRFPPWFYRKHPRIRANLERNRNRLSTAFDVHQTLLDILHSNFDGTQQPSKSRAQSQLYEIPLNRTCPDAGIPRNYCPCEKLQIIDNDAPMAKIAASHLLQRINSQLVSSCAMLKLVQIELAELFSPDGQNTDEKLVRVLIRINPGEALLQSLVQFDAQGDVVQNATFDVSRLTSYGNQADCVQDKDLRKVCYCT